MTIRFVLVFLALWSRAIVAQVPDLKIELHTGNSNEKKAEQLIHSLLKQYDLSPYIFTSTIKIQSGAVPHSHPVLTLNTRQIADPDRYLALFVHEEIHWFFSNAKRETQLKMFIARMKQAYPTVPSQESGGASNDESTYLHFGVCYYEFEALTRLLGQARASELFLTADVYSWIRNEVLTRRVWLKSILIESGLNWQDAKV